MVTLPEALRKHYKVVNYHHKSFLRGGKAYNLETLTVGQAEELVQSNWPYLVRVKKTKKADFPLETF
jgi:hypothetical protein